MKIAVWLVAVVLSSPVGAQQVPGAPHTDWGREHAEFTKGVLREYTRLVSGWREAMNGGHTPAALGSYTATAELLVSGHARVHGRDSIGVVLHSLAPSLVEIRMGLSEFLASDKLAYATGPLILAARDSMGTVQSYSGHHVTVLVREGRNWRIHSQVLHYLR